MPRNFTIPSKTGVENVHSIEHIVGVMVRVTVSQDAPGSGLSAYVVHGADYAELMSDKPSWAKSKPAKTFRDDDLWHFVDLIRAVKA